MAILYRDVVHGRRMTFWRRARIRNITLFCLVLGGLPAYFAQDLPTSDPTFHVSSADASILDDQTNPRTEISANETTASVNAEIKTFKLRGVESLEFTTQDAKLQNDSTEFEKNSETFTTTTLLTFENTFLVAESVTNSSRSIDVSDTTLSTNFEDESTKFFNSSETMNPIQGSSTLALPTSPPPNMIDSSESTYTPDTDISKQLGDIDLPGNDNGTRVISNISTYGQSQNEIQVQNLNSEDEIRLIANTAQSPSNEDTKLVEERNQSVYKNDHGHGSSGSTWRRICFLNGDLYRGLLASSESLFSEPVDMYMYYHLPNAEQPSSSIKHQYTKDESVDKSDVYGAYSLYNHKVVSRYSSANGMSKQEVVPQSQQRWSTSISNSTESETSEPDVFCIKIQAAATHDQQKSSQNTDDEMQIINPKISRKQKFHYKLQKKVPFQLDTLNTPTQMCEFQCLDKSACISAKQICDNIVHCADVSDEINCTCKQRMDIGKICDKYPDCPDGEDEQGCNDCPEDHFACTSGQKQGGGLCIPMIKRCDDVLDCAERDDEQNCEVLTETVNSHNDFTLGYTTGYLHRNWQGKWYPVCEPEINYNWAVKACASEIFTRHIHVEVEVLPYMNEYEGPFISRIGQRGQVEFTPSCGGQNRAVHVKCPPIPCGSRMPEEYFEAVYRSRRQTYEDPVEVAKILGHIAQDLSIIRNQMRNGNNDNKNDWNVEEGTHYNIHNHSRNNGSDFAHHHRLNPRVVEGNLSAPAKWPWVVAIFKNGNFHCGGTILDENWIMTAAHCVYRYEQNHYEVRAGVLRRLSFSPSEQIKTVSQIILHPYYVNSDMQNDLALLRLESPLNYNRWIRPICLPEARPPWGPLPGTVCTAIGWGTTVEKGTNPDNLRDVQLPILPNCKHLPDKQADEICAGFLEGGRDTCQGDSGGPLLCRIRGTRDRWYVAGVISHGEGCARPMEPGAYTRVALYISWLMQNTDYNFLRTNRIPKKDCPGIRGEIDRRCIPVKNICDRVVDCLNAEDEQGCLPPIADLINTYDSEDTCDKQSIYRSSSLGDYKHKRVCKRSITYDVGHKSSTNSRSSDETVAYSTTISYNTTTQFLCNRIVQVIPRAWHCDGDVDCEDGTDEVNCTCADFLRNENESLICDGTIHCYDASDEKSCLSEPCNETQFNCYKSHICIDRKYVCNKTPECPQGEDEENCYTIFPFSKRGLRSKLDYFGIPPFTERGILVRNEEGIWKPLCMPSEDENSISTPHIILRNLQKMGFKGLSGVYSEILVVDGDLQRPNHDHISYCQGIRVDLRHAIHETDYINVPWLADVYINGEQRCNGLLVRDRWIIADFACCRGFNSTSDMVMAIMGGGNSKSKVRSPYQQMIFAKKIKCHYDQRIMTVYLDRTPNTTSHTRVLQLPRLLDTQNAKTDVCYLLFSHENSMRDVIQVKSYKEDCSPEKRCYYIDNKDELCKKSNHSLHLNGVVCTQKKKWYLSSTVVGRDEIFCSSNINILEVDYLKNPSNIFVLGNVSHLESSHEQQRGFLCDLGNQIPRIKVCDGKPDCQYGEDENEESCSLKNRDCESNVTNTCGCRIDQFKCGTGECILKAFICDGEKDCKDGSDEPERCKTNQFSCAVYLNLTNPSKLCDLQQDCFDKSDEGNSTCPSNCDPLRSFNCTRSNDCIPLDFSCDGERDCPDGEDEEGCNQLRPMTPHENKGNVTVWTKSHGKWQELCVRVEEYTGLKEDELCQQLGFSHLLKSSRISSRRFVTHDPYTKIILNNGNEIQIKNRRHKNRNAAITEDCEIFNLFCEIKNDE